MHRNIVIFPEFDGLVAFHCSSGDQGANRFDDRATPAISELRLIMGKRRSMTRIQVSTALACCLLFGLNGLSGCSTKTEPTMDSDAKKVMPLVTLSSSQQEQKQSAIEAKDRLFESLLSELSNSLSEVGPAKSISVCRTRAPEIASQISQEAGVRIGRTSFKLRNKSNMAPDWAASFVAEKVEQPIEVALPNNELGVLLPIRLKTTCLLCHGDREQVMPEVKAAIVSNYPNDQATGFSEGDLRGYFWIEVPSIN